MHAWTFVLYVSPSYGTKFVKAGEFATCEEAEAFFDEHYNPTYEFVINQVYL